MLRGLGFRKRQPFHFNLFYWFAEPMVTMAVRDLLGSSAAEAAFAVHAEAARDEMEGPAREFQMLVAGTSLGTPNIDTLRSSGGA